MAKTQENRFFTLTVKTEKAGELKEKLIYYEHGFEELECPLKGYKFYKVYFKNSSMRNRLCNLCDYLNGFRNSPD